MKSVLFISVMNGAAWGGSEEIWYQSALWLAKHQYPVCICCFNWPEKQNKLQQLEKEGCKLFLLPGKKETKSVFGNRRLSKALKALPFNDYQMIVVNQGGWKDVVHGPFKRLFRKMKRYVLLYHNYNENEKLSRRKFLLLQQWTDNASKNVAASSKIFRVLEKSCSLSIPNQETLFNPLSFEAPQSVTPYPEAVNGKYIFSVFAALDTERKAQDVLIRALSGAEWRNRNWELHLYGGGKDKAMLEMMIARLQLQAKVFLKGHTHNVKQAIAGSHLVLQITNVDAMPISVMEALSMSRPVVVSNVGDMSLWIKENINGWVAGSVSVEAIHQTLEQAWNQRNNWEEMGKQSFAIFRRDFPANPVEYFLKQAGISG